MDGMQYYVEKGSVNANNVGLMKINGIWYYVENGYINHNYTGLVKRNGIWYYVEKGVLNWNYTGLAKRNGIWYYVERGQINWDYTGLVKRSGVWYYVEKGVLNWNYNGLAYKDQVWYYVEKGSVNKNYTGLVKDMQKRTFDLMLIAGHGQGDSGAVGNGYYESDLTRDLVNRINKVAIQKGINTTIYDMSKNAVKQIRAGNIPDFSGHHYCLEVHFNASSKPTSRGSMFYIHKDENGWSAESSILQRLYNLGSRQAWDGIVKASRQWEKGLLVQNNVKAQGVPHGLLETCFISNKDDVNWYLVDRDKIAEQVVLGIIEGFRLETDKNWTGYSAGTWYYVENGLVNWNYTGIVIRNGIGYYVERGTINWKFNGKMKQGDKIYTINNGIINL